MNGGRYVCPTVEDYISFPEEGEEDEDEEEDTFFDALEYQVQPEFLQHLDDAYYHARRAELEDLAQGLETFCLRWEHFVDFDYSHDSPFPAHPFERAVEEGLALDAVRRAVQLLQEKQLWADVSDLCELLGQYGGAMSGDLNGRWAGAVFEP